MTGSSITCCFGGDIRGNFHSFPSSTITHDPCDVTLPVFPPTTSEKPVNDCLSCCCHMLSRNLPLPMEVLDPDRLLASKEPIVAADSESAVYLSPHPSPSLLSEISADSCRKRGISRMVSRLAWRNFPFKSLGSADSNSANDGITSCLFRWSWTSTLVPKPGDFWESESPAVLSSEI